MIKEVKILIVFVVILGFWASNLWGEVITIEITAEIVGIDDRGGLLEGRISAGDTMTGSYTYDSDTSDNNPSGTLGAYWHYSSSYYGYGINLSIGGFVFQSDPDSVSFLLGIDNGTYGHDTYLLRSYNNLPLSNGVHIDHISWHLNDYSSTALSSDALPTTPPVLEDWEDNYLDITFGYKGSSAIGARVTSAVPEPAIEAEIDIDPDTLNLSSKGKWITCYIWLPEDYNVADIDPNSVFLEDEIGAGSFRVDEREQVATVRFSRSDAQSILNIGEVELTITGQLTDGTLFEGTDVIRVLNKASGRPTK